MNFVKPTTYKITNISDANSILDATNYQVYVSYDGCLFYKNGLDLNGN